MMIDNSPTLIAEPCQVTGCRQSAEFTRMFGWQISGATFLQIMLQLCANHARAVDMLKGETLPVTATLL